MSWKFKECRVWRAPIEYFSFGSYRSRDKGMRVERTFDGSRIHDDARIAPDSCRIFNPTANVACISKQSWYSTVFLLVFFLSFFLFRLSLSLSFLLEDDSCSVNGSACAVS